jgi:HAD superfamily hydrolase (TIGR01490 family)
MALAIFDLDHTLIDGDSDHAWGEFMVNKGLVDADNYRAQNDQFYADYLAGELDIKVYQEFVLGAVSRFTLDEIQALHREFMATSIKPMRLPKASKLLDKHRRQGDYLLIMTSTNRFITQPIANALGVDHLLATEGKISNQRYTGLMSGTACFAEGKVKRLQEWLGGSGQSLKGSYFYSDSHNDLPLLKLVDHPVAVDPDDKLSQFARKMNWSIISLRAN